jgi:hypothetical protein
MSDKETGLNGEIAALRQDIIAALEQTKIELKAELRTELRGIRSEIGSLRKAVEMVAVSLLSDGEVQDVRRAAAG